MVHLRAHQRVEGQPGAVLVLLPQQRGDPLDPSDDFDITGDTGDTGDGTGTGKYLGGACNCDSSTGAPVGIGWLMLGLLALAKRRRE